MVILHDKDDIRSSDCESDEMEIMFELLNCCTHINDARNAVPDNKKL